MNDFSDHIGKIREVTTTGVITKKKNACMTKFSVHIIHHQEHFKYTFFFLNFNILKI